MIEVTEYNAATGRIGLYWGFANQEMFDLNKKEGLDYIDGRYNGAEQYVVNSEIQPRPTFTPTADKTTIKADGVDVITISGLPSAMNEFRLDGPAYDAWEQMGDVQLTVNLPGTYTLRISQWPYQDAEVTFNAS